MKYEKASSFGHKLYNCRIQGGWRVEDVHSSLNLLRQCPSGLESHHLATPLGYTPAFCKDPLLKRRPLEVVSPSELMLFHFHNGGAGTAERVSGKGSREVVLLSSLLTARRLLAGTPGGIKLGQQLASREQNQVLTGCSPTHNYQYGVEGMSSFPSFSLPLSTLAFTLSLPVVLFARVAHGLSSLRRGQSRRTTALLCRTLGFSLGYRRHCAHRGFQ